MGIIRNVIEDFMSCAETSRMCNNIEFEKQTDDLRLLFQKVVDESEGTLQSISFHSLLRSLLSAAVCEWVWNVMFRSTFLPALHCERPSCPILSLRVCDNPFTGADRC